MTSSEIRASFLDFFKEKQHTIVPSSSLMPDAPNLLFTNAGMNQFVPIFLGQAPCPYSPARAADTQKCIRAGGKHNDLEDVGFDTYHHTFFEMLGNWSFGDYFKKEAIAWAWELVVGRWKFPASRIYATVYMPGPSDPANFDQEAHDRWAEIFIEAGLDPSVHVVHGNKKDNFWMMGDTGPCGPCSELHVDLTPGPRDLDLARQTAGRGLVNKGDARCIEIWNLVFIQFNANPDGTFGPLPAKHVDTGMGFERVTSMIQGTKGFTDLSENVKISNYETDVFRPIFDELEKLTGEKYTSTLPASAQNLSDQEKIDVAFRVIADHIRTLSFSIADGIQPSNEGRGYVLRRILRRAVRYGRNLGLREPFLGKLVAVLGDTMGHIFPEVVAKADLVRKTLTQEEESFLRTLERGIDLFNAVSAKVAQKRQDAVIASLSKDDQSRIFGAMRSGDFEGEWRLLNPEAEPVYNQNSIFPGADAFKLYDTYGFPLDLTELMAREGSMTIDVAEFDRLMEEQKAKGKAAQKKDVITVEGTSEDSLAPTVFYGYDELQSAALIVANENGALAVSETPFYAEMGGQVGDTGEIELAGKKIAVTNTIKSPSGKVYFHKLAEAVNANPGERVTLHVDEPRRAKIEAHHSGTHLLNWALRKVLGNTITQKGSYVGPDRLRFDFSHGAAVTPAELKEIERLVNEQIEADVPVKWEERAYAEVKGDPSILQFFGDKYGDTVRVVSIGDFSRELCGGTHVRQSAKVGHLRILSEGAIAAGIRRIEAASGDALIEHVKNHLPKQEELHSALLQRKTDLAPLKEYLGEETPQAFWKHWEEREAFLRQASSDVAQHEKDEAKRQEAAFQKEASAEVDELISDALVHGEIPFIVHLVDYQPAAYLPVLADAFKKHHWQGVVVLAAIDPGKVALLAAVSPAFTKKIQAGKIIQAIAPLVDGKGGGRPELAQGGGTNPGGVAAALAKAEDFIRGI
jgi:alanyl-tRNA synthetase